MVVSEIHDTDFRRKYRSNPVGAESLFEISGRRTEGLSGRWRFTVDPYDTALRAGWPFEAGAREIGSYDHGEDLSVRQPKDFDPEGWELIDVPASWNLIDPSYFWYEGSACYFRTFDFARSEEERVFLVFEGVSGDACVFLNNEQVGFHRGGSTPFCIEVTETLRSGTNGILVVADNTRSDERVPMSNTDWFNYGGIYRDVYLARVPRTFVHGFHAYVSGSGVVTVDVEVNSDSTGSPPGDVKRATVSIPELGLSENIDLSNESSAAGMYTGSVSFNADPQRWSPENPRRYRVEVTAGEDRIADTVGFRTIERRGNEILLNGQEVFLRGVSIHEDDPALGKTTTEDSIRRDFAVAKDLGCNFVRLAHYPHSREAARIADEMGLMVWEEIPVYWAIDFTNPDTASDARNQLGELIVRDRNRASVVVWSVGNENPDSDERLDFMGGLASLAKELDPTRLVSAACLYDHERNVIADRLADHLDIIGINEYFGWYDPAYEKLPDMLERSNPDRPVVLTEFGGGALSGHRGSRDELFTEDRQDEIYARQIEAIRQCSYVKGMTPWILFDFRCPRRTNRYQRFYNRKGLVDADHQTRKMAFYRLRDFYTMN